MVNKIKKSLKRRGKTLKRVKDQTHQETNDLKNKTPKNFFNSEISYESQVEPTVMFPFCGHLGPKLAILDIWGHILKFDLGDNFQSIDGQETVNSNDSPCPQCCFNYLKEHSIRCALCGIGIIPGEDVALYSKTSSIPHIELATSVGDNVVGCMRWDCCPSGAFFAGYWTEKGFKPHFESGNCIGVEAMITGKPQIR